MFRLTIFACPVTISGCQDAPFQRQVIHLCDWHYVPKDHFAADLRSDGEYSDDEIDSLYAEHLDDVEAVQKEQVEELRKLIREHGIIRAWVEGLTASDMPAFRELIAQTKVVEADVPRLQEMLSRAEGLVDSERASQEMLALLDEQRQRRLQIGAAGRLLMAGDLAEIMPLDNDATHKAAYPIRDGHVVQSEKAIATREEAIVASLLENDEPVLLIVLGAAHDLQERLERPGVEYKRVVPG